MGYTHYFTIHAPIVLSELQKTLIKEVLADHKDILRGGLGEGSPVFDDKEIWLNGNAEKDLEHETFHVSFSKPSDFEFCKTARKPYDLAVCKILLILSLSGRKVFEFRSDGFTNSVLNDGNWPNAIAWFESKGQTYIHREPKGK